MKTKLLIAIAIIGLVAVFTACDNGNNNGNGDPKTFTVTFDPDGGTPKPDDQTIKEGETATLPTTEPTRSGYLFEHWYNIADNAEWVFTTPITANVNLKAKWKQQEFTDLTFLGKSIKLIDQTGNAQDLKTRGIWQQLQDGFNASTTGDGDAKNKFYAIHSTGNFAIVITSGTNYPNGYAVDGYKILFNENQLSEWSASDIGNGICDIVWDDMPCIMDTERNLFIPIYKAADVLDTDASTATTNIQAGYTDLTVGRKNSLATAKDFLSIMIVNGDDISTFDPMTGIISIGTVYANDIANIKATFTYDVIPYIPAFLFQREYGIPIRKGEGVADFAAAVDNIKSAFEMLEEYSPTEATIIKNNVKEICVVPASGTNSNVLDKGKYIVTIKEGLTDLDIAYDVLYNLATEISDE